MKHLGLLIFYVTGTVVGAVIGELTKAACQ